MSRPLRIDYPGAWHHVMNRARKGNLLFHEAEDYERFLALLKETSAMFHMNVAAYCLMPNHYHILVQTEEGNLSRCMRHLNGIYTQRYNVQHKCDGTLFKGRYKSVLVQADSYLLQLIRYIHRNPVKAGLAETPDDYKWSSHHAYLKNRRDCAWLYTEFILSMISGTRQTQKNRYHSFMGPPVPDDIESFYARKNLPSILGGEDYIDWVRETFFKEKTDHEIPESKQLAPDISMINKAVADSYGIEHDQLFAVKRGSENEARNVAIFLARQLRGDLLNTIGHQFNLKRDSSVSSVLERVRVKLQQDKAFVRKVDTIKELLYKGQE